MRLAVIDLDWLEKRIDDQYKDRTFNEAYLDVREHTVPFLNSFSLSTLNLNTIENREKLTKQ